MGVRRILISGYYGFSNTGDEAVLSAIVAGLRSRQEGVEITVLSADPEETERLYGVRALPRTSAPHVSNALRKSDLLISGGGSLIQDATSLQSLVYYLGVISMAKFHRRKVMVFGQGVGPLNRSIARRLAARVLNGVNLITLRDTDSAELLCDIGVKRPPVHVTADPTFTLRPCAEEESAGLLEETGLREGEDIVAVSLRNWPESPELARTASETLRSLAERIPARLLLLALHKPDDFLLAKKAQGSVPGVIAQPRPWTGEQMLGVLSRCRLVVGMRLHALILAASVGTPSLGISYDPKVASFIAATGQEGITLREAESGSLADRVVRAWEGRDELAARLAESVPQIREAAERNIDLAVGLLES